MSIDQDPMPVFAIKAKDNLAVLAVIGYRALCDEHGLDAQSESVSRSIAEMVAWRERYPEMCKWPDHEHVPAGQPGSSSEPST